ncbi:LANO_0B05754g1_1 [Lachancea nothofagi CBS 11611]|uniref:Protein phosphatase n=1 Tax=Lachancea nothofagi CBS 11611 TaxID=1266666 RepID=A0A1G4IYL1_9SACH|nr:LANO_0B05754g1_1 [Lachancea nothofagi CBS 11611]
MFVASSRGGLRGLSRSRSMCICVVLALVLAQLLTGPDVYNWRSWGSRGFFSGSGSAQSGSSGFSYKHAVAYQAKDRTDGVYAGTQLDSPTGEDNYFVGMRSPHDVFAGVADGVGGWAEHGFDSSAISRELCAAIQDFSTLGKILSPKQLIDLAYAKVKNDGEVQVGGTTAIVAHFPPNGTMKVANLGDSWCGVFRGTKLVFQTKFQTVGFNAPYQLAIIPPQMLKEAAKRGGSYIQNKPSDADEYQFQLQKNDIILLATDGVTDNIATGDMELFLSNNANEVDLQKVSQKFVDQVVKLSKDTNFPSVFAQEMSRLSGKRYTGGKEDDITVVVVKVE